jgi:K+-sensing histidine kinase KdpD
MNRDAESSSVYMAVGPLAALALGVLLIPLRELTSASNLAFLFLLLTIVVAELGGRGPAVATALVSALSLNFFLTQPYLRLTIDSEHDIVAFLALASCGLLVATLGGERRERRAALKAAEARRDLVHAALAELEAGGEIAYRAGRLVEACRAGLSLSAAVLRGEGNRVVAGTPLPGEATRLPLTVDGRQVGWLDVWAGASPLDAEARASLEEVARIAAALIDLRPARPR